MWLRDFTAVTHRSSVNANDSDLLFHLLSCCQIQLAAAGVLVSRLVSHRFLRGQAFAQTSWCLFSPR